MPSYLLVGLVGVQVLTTFNVSTAAFLGNSLYLSRKMLSKGRKGVGSKQSILEFCRWWVAAVLVEEKVRLVIRTWPAKEQQ